MLDTRIHDDTGPRPNGSRNIGRLCDTCGFTYHYAQSLELVMEDKLERFFQIEGSGAIRSANIEAHAIERKGYRDARQHTQHRYQSQLYSIPVHTRIKFVHFIYTFGRGPTTGRYPSSLADDA